MNQNTNATIYQLEEFGCIQIDGQDASKFLQGQITYNLNDIAQGKLNLAAMCNPQGRCIAVFFITQVGQTIFLILGRDTIAATVANLKKYAVFFKTTIQDASDTFRIFSYLADQDVAQVKLTTESSPLNIAQLSNKLTLVLSPSLNSNDAENKLLAQFSQINNQQEWLFQLAKMGIPWLTAESQGEFLPHNLNLPELHAVDFKKGCFTGQEVIARMHYKGKMKTHLQILTSKEVIVSQPKHKILSSNGNAGEVICLANSASQGTIVLAVLKDSELNQQNFRLNDENGSILELINDN